MSSFAPFLIFYVGAVVVAVARVETYRVVGPLVVLLGAVNLYGVWPGASVTVPLLDFELQFLRVDKLSLLFGLLFHLAAFLAVIFSLHLRASKDRLEHAAGLAYAGSGLGAVFAGDLITLFIFWELLAVSATFLILARGTERAYSAAMRYLIINVLSGVVLLAGILLHWRASGSFAFEQIELTGPGPWLMLLAMGIKCAFPAMHTWLTDAYPEASPSATVFLSAFTTKVAVFALARCFAGTELLVYVGAAMAMFPIFFAVIENDLRRVLAYSLINQVGFMVVGVGIGTAMAINGAVAHAFTDVAFKGLLFITMGAVLYRTGKINGSDLGGLYKSMPWTTGFCLVGAASISAFPLFSGFISKSMIMVAAIDGNYDWVWLALLFASAGVFHHAGIKIPYFAFFAHDSGIRCEEAPRNMLVAMGLAAALCIFNGVYPWTLYSLLPYEVSYEPYTAEHILTQLQLLLFSALAFVWLQLRGLYPPELASTNLDTDWSYRRALPIAAGFVRRRISAMGDGLGRWAERKISRVLAGLYRHHGPQGILGRQWPTGNMAFWTTVLLGGSLLSYYL